jgi:glutamate--cysteine ligase
MNLHEIYQKFENGKEALNAYLKEEFQKTPPLFYLSCDLRNSDKKIAVVDTNLYPAGFNNLCKAYTQKAIDTFQSYLKQNFLHIHKLLIFSEAHTRNKFYFENLFRLTEILEKTGLEVRVATRSDEFTEDPFPIYLENEKQLDLHQVKREGNQISLGEGWIPDLIVSNNDFSTGVDELLQDIQQPIVPPIQLGWYRRRKSDHFRIYNEIAAEVGKLLSFDPWLISPLIAVETEIALPETTSLERLAQTVDRVLSQIKKKYEEYEINTTPYVFVKNNSGTYGMGLIYVSSGQEILTLNRKMRSKLLAAKGGGRVNEYLIQEGVITADFYSDYPMEPVVYLVGNTPIGGFFRLNEEKDEWSSLNTKGMAFSCLCLHKLDEPHEESFLRCVEKETLVKICFYLGQLAALAAAREGAKEIGRVT